MRRSRPGFFAVAATYVGTVVGAGFASGREILQFFASFGPRGAWGLGLATALFALFGILVMLAGRRVNAVSHGEVVKAVAGGRLGRWADVTITAFLLGATSVMFAGSGALFAEQLGMPAFLGSVLMFTLSTATVLKGLTGVVAANVVVAPVLLTVTIGTALGLAVTGRPGPVPAALTGGGVLGRWWLAALLYASYNLLLATPVLGPLGSATRDRRSLVAGAALGAAALGVAAAAIYRAILVTAPLSAAHQVPMLYVARILSARLAPAYAVILWLEIYTTAVGGVYGMAARLAGGDSRLFRHRALMAGLAALVASGLGFPRLVASVYPAAGCLGLLWLLLLLVRRA
ncbi:MAG: hypothetical protein RDU89_10215 [bacterium]|nr:hypothetical protein [bacterium]